MKVLSIIGVVLSIVLIATSIIMLPPDMRPSSPDYCNTMANRLLIHFLLGLFFLSFSIVGVVSSFKKKKL